jgi:methyl-accepting chemotaxis protein PixJ
LKNKIHHTKNYPLEKIMLVSQTIDQAIQAFESKDFAKAYSLFEQAQRQEPGNPKITLWLAKTHQALGHRAAAIEVLQKLSENSTEPTVQSEAKSLLKGLMFANGRQSETAPQQAAAYNLPTTLDRRYDSPSGSSLLAAEKPVNRTWRWSALSLRLKGTIAAIAIGVLPVLVVGVTAYQVANQAITKEISEAEEFRANALTLTVKEILLEGFDGIQAMANLAILTDSRAKSVIPLADRDKTMTNFTEIYGIFDSIAAFDLQGNVITQSKGPRLDNHSNRDYFQQVLKTGEPVISNPQLSEATGTQGIFFAAPIRDRVTQKVIGVVRTVMSVQTLQEELKGFAGGGQDYYLADPSGKFFVSNLPDAIGKTGEAKFPGYDKLAAPNQLASGLLVSTLTKDSYLSAFSPFTKYRDLPEVKWTSLSAFDTKVAFKPQEELRLTLIIGTAVVALVVAAIAAFLANRATRPLIDAADAVQKLGQGELDTRIDVSGEDELAVLGSNINQMAGEIQSLLSQTQQQAEQRRIEQEKLQQQVDTVAEGVGAIASGKLETRIPRLEGGEGMVQGLAENINQMTGQIQELVSAQEKLAEERKAQADNLTQQVVKLLSEVKDAAKGDLTVKAKVGEGEMGAVADSFNYLVNSLRRIVTSIKDTAGEVIKTTSGSIVQTTDLAHQAQSQAMQVEQTLKQIEQVVSSIAEVAKAAQQAETVVLKATQTAKAGGESVDLTVDGINQLRVTIGEAAKMMKRLGEGSQQIGQIVTLISQIAAKTDLLALNATIEAARAGEQGQGFAVVADEVRKLAERSAAATKEIAELVEGIQAETGRMIGAMDAGTEEVVRGSQLAANAKLNLQEIMLVSGEINTLVKNITLSTQNQTKVAAAITSAVQQTRTESNQTAKRATDVSTSLNELNTVVEELQGSVQSFRTV